ncbi:hypothetical protein [Azospirillum sp.]|uniref:hypothetical protein n=1 Tax=Azospirillum sp. TaxID=34012 RepID=UPI003D74D58A
MSQTGKPNPNAAPAREASGVDIEALEETVEEVVETLDVTVQAAEFVQARSPDPAERARAADIQQQAEAMLGAAKDQVVRPPRPADRRTMH